MQVALDIKNGAAMDVKITGQRTHNSQVAISFLDKAVVKAQDMGCKVEKVIADAGHDTLETFKYLGQRGVEAVIKVRKGVEGEGGIWQEMAGRGFLFSI